MDNKWKEIWGNKGIDFEAEKLKGQDEFSVYSALKKLDGFDVSVKEAENYYKSFYHSAIEFWDRMIKDLKVSSVYEIGCGCGANLYLLQKRGLVTGGIDYSENLAGIARKVLGEQSSIATGEAVHVSSDVPYDVVFSDSVFAYFPDEQYGGDVLEKMYAKARKAVVVTEIFDRSLRDECERHRKELFPDYEKRYVGLDKSVQLLFL